MTGRGTKLTKLYVRSYKHESDKIQYMHKAFAKTTSKSNFHGANEVLLKILFNNYLFNKEFNYSNYTAKQLLVTRMVMSINKNVIFEYFI